MTIISNADCVNLRLELAKALIRQSRDPSPELGISITKLEGQVAELESDGTTRSAQLFATKLELTWTEMAVVWITFAIHDDGGIAERTLLERIVYGSRSRDRAGLELKHPLI